MSLQPLVILHLCFFVLLNKITECCCDILDQRQSDVRVGSASQLAGQDAGRKSADSELQQLLLPCQKQKLRLLIQLLCTYRDFLQKLQISINNGVTSVSDNFEWSSQLQYLVNVDTMATSVKVHTFVNTFYN